MILTKGEDEVVITALTMLVFSVDTDMNKRFIAYDILEKRFRVKVPKPWEDTVDNATF